MSNTIDDAGTQLPTENERLRSILRRIVQRTGARVAYDYDGPFLTGPARKPWGCDLDPADAALIKAITGEEST